MRGLKAVKFCTSCGSALEFFEFLDGELCSSCLKNRQSDKEANPSIAVPEENGKHESLADMEKAVLSFENGKLILKSPEGWILWSGPANEKHQIKTVLGRARQILKIRKKRKKQ